MLRVGGWRVRVGSLRLRVGGWSVSFGGYKLSVGGSRPMIEGWMFIGPDASKTRPSGASREVLGRRSGVFHSQGG